MWPTCPKCGSKKVLYVIIGHPTDHGFELERKGKAMSTGCIIMGNEKNSYCKNCEYEWDREWTDEELA